MPLPFLVEGDHDEEVLCPQLEEVIGRLTGEQRWSRFLEAGSRTSKEFQEAWLTLTAEAISIFNFLKEEPSGPLSVPTAEAGGRSTDGSTRMRVVQQKEMLRYKLMDKALSNFCDSLPKHCWWQVRRPLVASNPEPRSCPDAASLQRGHLSSSFAAVPSRQRGRVARQGGPWWRWGGY